MMLQVKNGMPVSRTDLPVLPFERFTSLFSAPDFDGSQKRVLAFWELPDGLLCCVLGNPVSHKLEFFATPANTYHPFAERCPALYRFEQEWLGRENEPAFISLKGEVAHEVAVGPVHAGVIEPGHFRFQCMGERVHTLDIALGYQHRGAERLIAEASNDIRRIALAETVAGDSSVASALAAARVLGVETIPTSVAVLLLELERIANHVGDLGALSGDVAYLPTASFCGRIRGEYLNMTAAVCGNRFGRNVVTRTFPNTARAALSDFGVDDSFRAWFARTKRDLFHALDLLFTEAGALDRFLGTGTVSSSVAREIGLTGLAGRASGLAVDSRCDFPMSGETVSDSLVGTRTQTGDVLSRAWQRYDELRKSHEMIEHILRGNRAGETVRSLDVTADSITVSVIEAWRGELVHLAVRGKDPSRVEQYKIFDPSFHNWFGLSLALRGEEISNFPICNKSFNLSYCGVDR